MPSLLKWPSLSELAAGRARDVNACPGRPEIISASLPDDLHLRLDCLSSEVSPVVHALPLDDLLLALGGGPSSHTPDSAASAQASTWLEDLSGQELMVTLRQEGPTWGRCPFLPLALNGKSESGVICRL